MHSGAKHTSASKSGFLMLSEEGGKIVIPDHDAIRSDQVPKTPARTLSMRCEPSLQIAAAGVQNSGGEIPSHLPGAWAGAAALLPPPGGSDKNRCPSGSVGGSGTDPLRARGPLRRVEERSVDRRTSEG